MSYELAAVDPTILNVVFGLVAYLFVQLSKSNNWRKAMQYVYPIGIAVFAGAAKGMGIDAKVEINDVLGVLGSSQLIWAAGKMTGIGEALKKDGISQVADFFRKLANDYSTDSEPVKIFDPNGVNTEALEKARNEVNAIKFLFDGKAITLEQAREMKKAWNIKYPDLAMVMKLPDIEGVV
ncbi:hypothetical protein HYS94_02240 [Candidatus Daviesbacteria bacterium]|nr:hypothetical protein [Candidatus Daviesbacteria bacterium]